MYELVSGVMGKAGMVELGFRARELRASGYGHRERNLIVAVYAGEFLCAG